MKNVLIKKITLILLLIVIVQSCTTNKNLSSSPPVNEVSNLEYFEPFTYIQFVVKGNKPVLNDSLSSITKQKMDSVIFSKKGKFRINNKIILNDKNANEKVEKEFVFLIQSAINTRKLEGIPLTPTIDSILESRNQRFAIGIVGTGFGRRKGNYGGQVAKGVAVGLLTLGLYIPSPVKSNLTLYSVIVDSEKNEITFFRNTSPVEKSPTDPRLIEKQLDKLYKGYLF